MKISPFESMFTRMTSSKLMRYMTRTAADYSLVL